MLIADVFTTCFGICVESPACSTSVQIDRGDGQGDGRPVTGWRYSIGTATVLQPAAACPLVSCSIISVLYVIIIVLDVVVSIPGLAVWC